MGDVGDYWRDARDYRRQQKAKKEPFNDTVVSALGKLARVAQLGEHGPHLRINGALDFWPSTNRQLPLKDADPEEVAAAKKAIKAARKVAFAKHARAS